MGFCGCEDLDATSDNLTNYLLKGVQVEPSVAATQLHSEPQRQ